VAAISSERHLCCLPALTNGDYERRIICDVWVKKKVKWIIDRQRKGAEEQISHPFMSSQSGVERSIEWKRKQTNWLTGLFLVNKYLGNLLLLLPVGIWLKFRLIPFQDRDSLEDVKTIKMNEWKFSTLSSEKMTLMEVCRCCLRLEVVREWKFSEIYHRCISQSTKRSLAAWITILNLRADVFQAPPKLRPHNLKGAHPHSLLTITVEANIHVKLLSSSPSACCGWCFERPLGWICAAEGRARY